MLDAFILRVITAEGCNSERYAECCDTQNSAQHNNVEHNDT
jgi:hypothetical protein